MDADKQQQDNPLGSEALKRDEWRGGETILRDQDASGHTVAESESDPATEGAGQQGAGAVSATVPPPD